MVTKVTLLNKSAKQSMVCWVLWRLGAVEIYNKDAAPLLVKQNDEPKSDINDTAETKFTQSVENSISFQKGYTKRFMFSFCVSSSNFPQCL